jgi:arylsulfatase A
MILHSPNGNFAIRQGRWKYVEGKACPTLKKIPRRDELGSQLYDLDEDPAEQHNVLEENPDVANRLADLLAEQRNKGRTR